jgi:hypothetical protein
LQSVALVLGHRSIGQRGVRADDQAQKINMPRIARLPFARARS